MQVKEIVSKLANGGRWEYRGDLGFEFNGFYTRPRKKFVQNKTMVVIDDSWGGKVVERHEAVGSDFAEVISRARRAGATGIICSFEHYEDQVLEGLNVFYADDTFRLSQELTRACRFAAAETRITGVTGSVGKSTVSAMIQYSLEVVTQESVFLTPGNANLAEHAMCYSSQCSEYQHAVLEVSLEAFERWRGTEFTISPNVAVFTPITAAHLERVGGVEEVADLKADIFNMPPPGGTAVISTDTEFFEKISQRAVREGCQLVTYGTAENATIRLIDYELETGKVTAGVGREVISYTLGIKGRHNALNSLAVIGTLRAHGVSNWRDALTALADFKPVSGRGTEHRLRLDELRDITLIDEAFNANLASIRASVESLTSRTVGPEQRKVAVLGDVLELGAHSETVHRSMKPILEEAGLDYVYLFGQEMYYLANAMKNSSTKFTYFSDIEQLSGSLLAELQNGDTVLFKASGGTGLKDFVKEVIKNHS